LKPEEKKKLNIFCDNVERVEKKKYETVTKIQKLVKKVVKNYQVLSESIFDLGEQFKQMAEGYKTIESLSGSGLKTDFLKQGDLYETLTSTCIDASKAIQRSSSNFERHLPPFFKLQESNYHHLEHVTYPIPNLLIY